MCYVIESKHVFANFLKINDLITLDVLNKIANKIEEEIPSICVDVSHYSISSALEHYPTMFVRTNAYTIVKSPDSQDRFSDNHLNIFFNNDIPVDIRESLITCIMHT